VALAVAALSVAGCGDDKAASADSSATATPSTTTAQTTTATQPPKVLVKSADYDQQFKTVPPPDGAKKAITKPAATKTSKTAEMSTPASGGSNAGVGSLATFGNGLIKAKAHPHVSITTNRGTFVVEVEPEGVPIGAANFVSLAAHHFYDKLTFHRVEPGFVIQGGDPEGTGRGGPGYTIPDESGPLLHEAGAVAWAKAGPDTAGSQFYVTLAPAHPLDHAYTVFGKIISGMNVVQATQIGDVMKKVVVTGVPANLKVPYLAKK
ncbi:MAG: peptidylprolyl isomerase, partial [Armatimonadota bacterium]|nr:peptidylprolyl isomerase [Armatimonadota bacterium]